MYRELPGIIRRMRPDVVHVLSEPWGALPLQTLVVARRGQRSIPVCVQAADNIFVHGFRLEQVMRRRILAGVLPKLAGFVGWTSEVIDLAHRFGLHQLDGDG